MVDNQKQQAHVEASSSKHIQEIQAIRTKLLYIQQQREFKSLAVVSTESGSGRTSVAVDLAKSIANTGRSVVLLDADLSSSSSMKALLGNKATTASLSEYLEPSSQLEVAQVVSNTEFSNLSLVANAKDIPNATDLLGSEKMTALVAYLESNYDLVIIDTPELIGKPDGMIMVNLADAVLLVAKLHHTLRSSVAKGMNMLKEVNANVVGWVENHE